MDLVLHRRAGASLREQIIDQIELKLSSGELKPGERLPSVRALARRLKVHPNTVASAYGHLEARGRLFSRRGSGVFVCQVGPTQMAEARNLDEMIRLALKVAFERHSGAEVRSAVLRWLAGSPPTSVIAIDPSPAIGELLALELAEALGIPAAACSVAELARYPGRLTGALGVALPSHVARVRDLVPGASVESISIGLSTNHRDQIGKLPPGAVVLTVSQAQEVLHFASTLVRSLRGPDVLFEGRLLAARREWKRLVTGADLVLADRIAHSEVSPFTRRPVKVLRLVDDTALHRLRSVLPVVVPAPESR